MAALDKLLAWEMLADDEEDEIWQYMHKCRQISWLNVSLMNSRRECVPKIQHYMTNVVQHLDLPEHIDDFKYHFRVSRGLFHAILDDISHILLRKGSGPQTTVPPEKQLLVCLCYLANNQSMREVAHTFNLSKSTVHNVIGDVCKALYQLGKRVIKWPSAERQQQTAQQVQEVCTLPGVIGFLDGTHIRLSTALGGEKDYYNRKGFPSMQMQGVVDEEMTFIHVYTGWPGCEHDARVLRNSALFHKAEAGELILQNHHIFADNAYPLRNWLITPFRNLGNLTRPQLRFNKRLSSVRQTVERAFAHLKGRFRRLKDVPLHHQEEICTLIYACCVLHNLCIRHNDDVDTYVDIDEENDPNQFINVYQNGHVGVVRRLQLVNH